MIKQTEIIAHIRATAKRAGLVFKMHNGSWAFADRKTKRVVLICSLGEAWANVESGYVESYDIAEGRFIPKSGPYLPPSF